MSLGQIADTEEQAPSLCYTAGIRYPTHKIADGAIPKERLGRHSFDANILKDYQDDEMIPSAKECELSNCHS